jgi:hypothetical protein
LWRFRALDGLAVVTVLGAVSAPAFADDLSTLATRLSELRGQVEELASRLSTASNDHKETLRSLSRQRSELELEAKREETRVQKLSAAIAKRKAEIQAEKAKGDRLVPVYEEAFAKVRGYVEQGLPFRQGERLAALDKIQEQYKGGLLTPARALQRLWSFIEDEYRMSKESGLYKQTITIDGQERLAEVIRVGMVMLYYKTEGGRVGRIAKQGEKFEYTPIDDPEQQKRVLGLFTSFKKQIRVGYFELPNALVDSVHDVSELPKLPVSPGPDLPPPTEAPSSEATTAASHAAPAAPMGSAQ